MEAQKRPPGARHPPQRLARGNEVRVGKEMWQGVVERDGAVKRAGDV